MTDVPVGGGNPLGGAGGARWCETHRRWECTHQKSRGRGQCHEQAVRGTDSCDGHGGKPTEVMKAEGEARIMLAQALSDASPRHPGQVLLRVVHAADVLMERLLERVPDGEVSAEQVELLQQTIDRAGRWAKAAVDADAADRWVRAQESVASRHGDEAEEIYRAAQRRLGRPWDDPEVRQAYTEAIDEVVGRRTQEVRS